MDSSEVFFAAGAIALALLPAFLFGLAGGLWCWRVRTSILIGLTIGLFATVVPIMYQSRNPMVLWGETAYKLFLFFVVPAVLGGLVGPKVRSRSLQRYPVVLTMFACLLGALGYMFLLLAWSPARAIALQEICSGHLKKIGWALSMYADAHQGHLPPEDGAKGLDYLLRENFLNATNDVAVFLCPYDQIRHKAGVGEPLTEDSVSYVYKGSLWQPGSPANAVPICWDKIENHRSIGLNVLFKDGHVEWVRLKRWEKIKPAQ